MSNRNLVQDPRWSSHLTKVGTVRRCRAGAVRSALFRGLFLVAVQGAACAGPKYHISDAVLSERSVAALSDQADLLTVQEEVSQAAEEQNQAKAFLAIDEQEIDVAQAEHAQVCLESHKLEGEVRTAERGQDRYRIRPAQARLTELHTTKSLSDAKLNWLQRRRDYHRTLAEVAERHGAFAERRDQLEKARLIQSSDKIPSKDFNLAQVERQAAQAQKKYEDARARANQQQIETWQFQRVYSQLAYLRPQS